MCGGGLDVCGAGGVEGVVMCARQRGYDGTTDGVGRGRRRREGENHDEKNGRRMHGKGGREGEGGGKVLAGMQACGVRVQG